MAAANSLHAPPAAAHESILLHGRDHISAAGRLKPACPGQARPNGELIDAHHRNEGRRREQSKSGPQRLHSRQSHHRTARNNREYNKMSQGRRPAHRCRWMADKLMGSALSGDRPSFQGSRWSPFGPLVTQDSIVPTDKTGSNIGKFGVSRPISLARRSAGQVFPHELNPSVGLARRFASAASAFVRPARPAAAMSFAASPAGVARPHAVSRPDRRLPEVRPATCERPRAANASTGCALRPLPSCAKPRGPIAESPTRSRTRRRAIRHHRPSGAAYTRALEFGSRAEMSIAAKAKIHGRAR